MKTGKTLQELAVEIERQREAKKDYIADTSAVLMTSQQRIPHPLEDDQSMPINQVLHFGGNIFDIAKNAHNQISARLGIPKRYYDRMRVESPELLTENVNHWFKKNPEKRMIRTLDDKARAFLSDRYRPLDNFDLLEAILPKVQEMGCDIVSCDVTDSRMYIKVISDKIQTEVAKGDIVQAGLVISNSEVGCGSLRVEPLIYRLVCLNGMISADHSMKKYHVGRGFGSDDATYELLKDETRKQDDKAFFMKVRDVVDSTLTQAKFQFIVQRMIDSKELKIEGDVVKAVDQLVKEVSLTEREGQGVLRHLIEGGDLSQFGVLNAITRASQDVEDYDRATDLERIGGQVIELPRTNWNRIATAC